MDHLKTNQERKNRWYAKHIKPNYVTVHTLDLDSIQEGAIKINKLKEEENLFHYESLLSENKVPGIPISLLHLEETKLFLRSFLKQCGFVVIRNVLNVSECSHALDLAWDYIESASAAEHFFQTEGDEESKINNSTDSNNNYCTPPVRRGEYNTYNSKYFPRSLEGNIFPFYGSGHSSFMWYLRSHPLVQEVFATIHNVRNEDLITSLDGLILWNKMDINTLDKGWFHIDQNPETRPMFSSIQGLVNLLPVTSNTGGNISICGSHRLFPSHYLQNNNQELFYKERLKEIKGDDWLEIDSKDELLFQPGNNVIACLLDPGDVLIWDSRTVHCSYPGEEKITKNTLQKITTDIDHSSHGLIRAAGLVNMIPRVKCYQSTHMGRLDAITCSRTLTHYPDKVAPLGEERSEEVRKEECCVGYMKKKQVQLQGKKVLLSFDDLSEEQKKLI